MSTRIPPKPPLSRTKIPSSNPTQTAPSNIQSNQKLTNAVARTTETFKKRRNVLWAIGVAVITGAGAILGAQLKTNQQAKERLGPITPQNPSADTEAAEAGDTALSLQTFKSDEKLRSSPTVASTDPGTSYDNTSVKGANYDERQIAFLEDRRGVLMRQKFDLEKKIERVREKRRREEDVERRRNMSVVEER